MSAPLIALLALGLQAPGRAPHTVRTELIGRVAIVPRSWSTVVAIAIAFPWGSAEDPVGEGGLARLAAEAVAHAASGRSVDAGAVFAAEVTRDATFFSVLAVPEAWPHAYRAIASVLFGGDLPPQSIAAARATLAASLRAEAGAPVRDIEIKALRVLLGGDHPWARRVFGRPETLGRLQERDVQRWFADRFSPERATVVVVGPVDSVAAAAKLPARDTLPLSGVAPSPTFAAGARITLYREVTSTWITVAFPVRPGTPGVVAELLAHDLDRRFSAVPRDPALFEASVRLERIADRDVLFVVVVVMPEDAPRWERRILEAVERLADSRPSEPAFRSALATFRSALALHFAYPEHLARRRAEAFLRPGWPPDPLAELPALTPAALTEAARALGAPAILIYGPDLRDADGGRQRD